MSVRSSTLNYTMCISPHSLLTSWVSLRTILLPGVPCVPGTASCIDLLEMCWIRLDRKAPGTVGPLSFAPRVAHTPALRCLSKHTAVGGSLISRRAEEAGPLLPAPISGQVKIPPAWGSFLRRRKCWRFLRAGPAVCACWGVGIVHGDSTPLECRVERRWLKTKENDGVALTFLILLN